MMKSELLEAWVNELRARQNSQTYGYLKTEEIFFDIGGGVIAVHSYHCALGVLLDLFKPDGWLKRKDEDKPLVGADREYVICYHRRSDGEDGIEPDTLKEIGLSEEVHRQVIAWNDACKSFDWIANKLEKLLDL